MVIAVLAVISITVLCLILGSVIGLFASFFAVEVDPRIEETNELLPGANCGGCGYAGCADFAKAVVAGDAGPEQCPVSSQENTEKIAKMLGMTANTGEKQVAIVLCSGHNANAKKAVNYNGVKDCKSSVLVASGDKACEYGCLGFASCARACPFGAIEMHDGLAIVHPELCVACGKCVEVCPRNLIKLVPAKAQVHIFCNSPEKGAAKKKVCSVSCIGCRKCVKAAEEEGQMEINGFLVQVNYDNPPGVDIIEKAQCPTNCLRSSVK